VAEGGDVCSDCSGIEQLVIYERITLGRDKTYEYKNLDYWSLWEFSHYMSVLVGVAS
jgi:hypothetical protein